MRVFPSRAIALWIGVLACSGEPTDPDAAPGKPRPRPAPAAVPEGTVITVAPSPAVAYPQTPYPAENQPSDDKAMLGKFLFWDEQMSADDTVACGTCHRPRAGGSDPRSARPEARRPGPDLVPGTDDDVHGSLGIVRCDRAGKKEGKVQVTGRKAPSYLDAFFEGRLFWDGRAECAREGCPTVSAFEDPDRPGTFPIRESGALENQSVGPPMSNVEMACEGASWAALHGKLARVTPLARARALPAAMQAFRDRYATYPRMFEAAFGTEQTSGLPGEINTRRIAFAIATHERRLRSDQTPWDRWNAGVSGALTPVQLWGYDLFKGKAQCGSCHGPPVFTDGAFHFTGFFRPAWDPGRGKHSLKSWEAGAMRTVNLRNVGLREPGGLLHTGAGPGTDLESVVTLYDKGGRRDWSDVAAVPISASVEERHLTEDERLAIVEFLRHGLTDPRVASEASPFDRPTLGSE
jgi:cytochrome c peroxidase